MNETDACESDDAELQHEPRRPFSPLRFIDMIIENWKNLLVLLTAMHGAVIVGLVAPEWVARTGLMVLIGNYVLALIPRSTLYGDELGMWPAGELYDRWFGGEQA